MQVGCSAPSSRSKASAAARAPICWLSWRTTVTPSRSASSKSSKPTRASSWSASRSARSAPTALRLLPANSAVGRRLGREGEQLADDGLGLRRVVRAEADELLADRHAGRLQGLAVAGQALGGGVELGRVGDQRDPLVAVGEQVLDRRACAAEVVEQHAVGVEPDRRAVEEHDRGVHGAFEVVVVARGGDEQQGVDTAAQQRLHELALALGVLLARRRDQQVAALASGRLDRLRDRRVERVGDVLDDEAERGGGAALAQRAREVVALEAELVDRVAHPRGGRHGDAGLLVDDAGDRLQAHAGPHGDVAHGGPRGAQDGHRARTTLSDNVVSGDGMGAGRSCQAGRDSSRAAGSANFNCAG